MCRLLYYIDSIKWATYATCTDTCIPTTRDHRLSRENQSISMHAAEPYQKPFPRATRESVSPGIISHCGCIDQDRADLSSCRARPVLSTSRKLSSESVQLANLGRATPIKQRRRLTSAARPRSYCEPRSMQSRSGQARGGSERQYESSDKKRSISATSGHSRWWRWALVMSWANSDPGCARSAPTRAPPRHAPRVPEDASFVPLAGARASLTEFLMMAVTLLEHRWTCTNTVL